MKYPSIRLTKEEVNLCKEKASERQKNRERANSVDRAPIGFDPLKLNVMGMYGEVSVHRFLNIPVNWYEIGANEFTGDSDVKGMIEVRTTQSKPYSFYGSELDLRESDLRSNRLLKTITSCWIKVVVIDLENERPSCLLRGWSMGYEIIANNKLQPRRKGKGFCIYQPDANLHHLEESSSLLNRIKPLQKIAKQTYETHF